MAVVSNGTTIIDAGALGSGVATGKMTLIKTIKLIGKKRRVISKPSK